MEKALNLTAACCMALFSFLGNKTAFPLSTDYEASLSSYFSIQEGSLRPACIVSPDTTEDVANAVRILTNTSLVPPESDDETCKFAIRSGGHSSNLYAANINNGITIDLRRLNSITVSPDRSMVAIGVGNTWDSVYSKLDAMDLGVTGGRTAGVGVGGLSLGGGISYFSTRYGWTSDTIINFEVVLANGSIVNANKEENRELHWALKGGGNNFGIVTRVDLRSFSQGPFWGGALYFPTTVWEHTAQEFLKFNSPHSYDEYAALTLSWGYSSSSGTAIAANMEYTKAIENPSIFAGFTSLPSLFGNTSITNMTQLSVDLRNEQVLNERQFWGTSTLLSTEACIKATYMRVNESIPAFSSVANVTLGYTLEPLPPAFYSRYENENPFGLGTRNQSLIIALLTVSWTDPADDKKVEEAGKALIEVIEKDARDIDSYDPFLYFNYAGAWQDPVASYGVNSVERLKQIASDVDPKKVFTHQVPGGFKIF